MGIRDRRYMGGQPTEPESSVGPFVMRLLTALFAIYLVFFCIRFPLSLIFKLPLIVGIACLIRLLWGLPTRMERNSFLEQALVAEKNGNFMKAAYNYERAVTLDPNNVPVAIKLLSAYEASNQIIKAKELIKAMDGTMIPDRHVEEFEHLVLDYRLVTLEKVSSGQRVRLRNSAE